MNAGERIGAFETKSTSVSLMGGQTESTRLITAVEKGNPDCMKILLSYKADIEGQGQFFSDVFQRPFQYTPLFKVPQIW